MKVAELREKLSKLNKEDLSKLAVEFYKLIPKQKKEDYDIDELISNPQQKKNTPRKSDEISLSEMEVDIPTFIEDVRNMHYISPNRVVPKKERATWRFKVKRWHKELTNTNRLDANLKLQVRLLRDLYEILCESCQYQYFTAYDSFESVGVDQPQFFLDIINLLHKTEGKPNTLESCIRMVVKNEVNRYTLYSELMEIVISRYDTPDMKYKGIEILEFIINENDFKPDAETKRNSGFFSFKAYREKECHNNLTEFVLRFYLSLYENNEGIKFFNARYYDSNPEIKLYVLVSILLQYQSKDDIKNELEKALQAGLKIRPGLNTLLDTIKTKNTLPEYMP